MNYEEYKVARLELSELVADQLNIVKQSNYDTVVKTKEKPSGLLLDMTERLKDEQLRVLVMGKFSSGKSSFLNGLLGEAILPMKVTPCTAAIGEIRYAEKETVTLYPKPGKWHKGDEPFTIDKAELKNYIVIETQEDEKKENPFKKVIINLPLQICKKGIELVDSPGLDDPDSHDEVTKAYLPTADAIIYCMSALQAFSKMDKEIINELIGLGHTSIFFVITYYDFLVENDILMGTHEAENFKKETYKKLAPLTNLGNDGIFFVNSLAALKGKISNNPSAFESYDFPQMEIKMENFLVNQKGKLKLTHSIFTTKKINREAGRYMQDSVSLLEKDSHTLREMVQSAKLPLEQATSKGKLIRLQVQNSFRDIEDNVKDKANLFILNCISKIDTWVNEHTPANGISANPLNLKKSIRNYTQSCIDYVKYRMEEESQQWSKRELSPMIQKNLKVLFTSMEDNIRSYNRDLLDVRVKLDLASEADMIAEEKNPGTFSRLASVAYTIATFDFIGGAVGIGFGLQGLLRTLAAQLVAGLIIGMVSLFTPVGLPAFIIGAVIASVTGAGWTVLSIKKNIKKKIIEKTKESLSAENKKREIVSNITSAVKKVLSGVQNEVDEAVDADINSYQKLMDEASEIFTGKNQHIRNQITLYKQLLAETYRIADKLDEFGKNL